MGKAPKDKLKPSTGLLDDSDMSPEDQRKNRFATFMRSNPTSVEKRVWAFIGKYDNPWGFEPQVVQHGFILDFFTFRYNVCLEADGPVHDEQKKKQEDLERDKILLKHGIRTIRVNIRMLQQYGRTKIFQYFEDFIAVSPKGLKNT